MSNLERKILRDWEIEGKIFMWVIFGYLALDFIGAIMWAMSGQIPPDSFFLGSITRFILQVILG